MCLLGIQHRIENLREFSRREVFNLLREDGYDVDDIPRDQYNFGSMPSEPARESEVQSLERIWRNRLFRALDDLEIARARLKDAEVLRSSQPVGHPDGEFAYREAVIAERIALLEYSRVLSITTDLIVHGKLPHDLL